MKKLLIPALVAVALVVGYFAGRYSARVPNVKSAVANSGVELGPWQAVFRIPGSVQMPESSPLVKWDVPRQTIWFKGSGILHVIMTNLTGRWYVVSYVVHGYNAKRQRISEGVDKFYIGGHETVNRDVMLESHESNDKPFSLPAYGRSFTVALWLKH